MAIFVDFHVKKSLKWIWTTQIKENISVLQSNTTFLSCTLRLPNKDDLVYFNNNIILATKFNSFFNRKTSNVKFHIQIVPLKPLQIRFVFIFCTRLLNVSVWIHFFFAFFLFFFCEQTANEHKLIHFLNIFSSHPC